MVHGKNLSHSNGRSYLWQLIFHSSYACFCGPDAVFKAVSCISLSKKCHFWVELCVPMLWLLSIPTVCQVGVTSHV